jgi:hypothetical protein
MSATSASRARPRSALLPVRLWRFDGKGNDVFLLRKIFSKPCAVPVAPILEKEHQRRYIAHAKLVLAIESVCFGYSHRLVGLFVLHQRRRYRSEITALRRGRLREGCRG